MGFSIICLPSSLNNQTDGVSPIESYFSLKQAVPLDHFPHPDRRGFDEEIVNQDLVPNAAGILGIVVVVLQLNEDFGHVAENTFAVLLMVDVEGADLPYPAQMQIVNSEKKI